MFGGDAVSGYGMGLFSQHAAMLAASGITAEHARARGYVSVDTKRRLEKLNFTKGGCIVPGLLVPSRRVDGSVWGYQYRPDKPRLRHGKPVKYETPFGQRNGLDVPNGVGDKLEDPGVPLWITEGAKKADAGALAGLCIVALSGVWSWLGTNARGGKVAIPDWRDVALNNRRVILAFDSDVVRKRSVRAALDEIAGYLSTKGAAVEYLHLPDDDATKTGVDDYLAAGHTVEDLWKLVRPDAPEVLLEYAPVEQAALLSLLEQKAASVRVSLPAAGKDAADHIAAGHCLDELVPVEVETPRSTGPVTVTLSSVFPELVTWVWPGRLPGGKISVLDGDPSVGKSTMAVDWAARVSTGTPWPDGSPCVAGDVLVMSAEDGLADTIRPRLDAAGGDADRVHSLRAIHFRDDDGNLRERAITLADTDAIEQAVRRHHAHLVIVDVLMAYLPTGTDSHKDQDIRTVLSRVAKVAEDTGCCVLLLRHMNKTSGGNVLYRGGGSIGIVGAARAAYVAAPDPDDETGTKRVLACTKNNLAPMPASLAYQLTPASNGTASVSWQGETATSAATLLSVLSSSDERTERDEALEWLLAYLEHHDGTVKRADAIRDAKRDGIAQRTLERARDRAGVRSERAGFGQGADWTTEATVVPFAPQSRHSRQAPEAGATGANGGATVKRPALNLNGLPGRCHVCEFHIEMQGHATDCTERTAP